jgi:ABC-type bacteriocin/lantibiotic exporter with double-glycine peptidase domain
MFWYSWQLTLIALAALAAITAVSLFVSPIFRTKLNNQFKVGARNTAFVTEYLAGMATVKSLQMEPTLERRYGEQLAQYLAAGFETRQLANTYNTAANALEQIMTLAILLAGALLVMDSAARASVGAAIFTIGMLVAFQMFASRLSQPMLRLVGTWQQFQQARVAIKRLGDVMDMPTEPHTLAPQRAASAEAGHIEFQSVSFRYSERHPWLYRNLSLAIRPGQLTVLVGASGSGKSTLAKLLLGFYSPIDGRILIDGQDTQHMAANELRANFGVVPQETTLFSGSVLENLQMANPHAGFEQIVEACRMAEIHEVIASLPQGYQTPLGEQGVGLSGGQRQRIAIARAIVRNPAILLLDEATSALDPGTEAAINATLRRLSAGRTAITVTHRLASAKDAGKIYVLDGGRLVESGTHDELVAAGGLYDNLWQRQSGFTLSDAGDHAEVTVERLKHVPVLADLEDELLDEIAVLFANENVPADRVVVQQGDPGDRFYLVVRGRLSVKYHEPGATDETVAVLQDGDHFGEIALLRSVPRVATVTTESPTLLLSLARKHFLDVLERAPDVRRSLEETVEGRLAEIHLEGWGLAPP